MRRFYYSILERKITETALDSQDYNQRELRCQSKQSVSKERQVSVNSFSPFTEKRKRKNPFEVDETKTLDLDY